MSLSVSIIAALPGPLSHQIIFNVELNIYQIMFRIKQWIMTLNH